MERCNSMRVIFVFVLLGSALTILAAKAQMETAPSQVMDWEYQMAYQRGIEAVNRAVPAVSMINYREAHFGLGGGFNTVYYLSTPRQHPGSKS